MRITVILIFILSLLSSFARADELERNYKVELEKKLKHLSIIADIEYRNDGYGIFHRQYDVAAKIPIKKTNFSVSIKHRHVYRKENGEWDLHEQRPQIQLNHKLKAKFVELKTRLRHEYRIFDGDDISRGRARIKISPAKTLFGFKPFISEEYYYDYKTSRNIKNRFEAGIAFPTMYKYFIPSITYRLNRRYDSEDRRWNDNSPIIFEIDVRW